MKLYPFIFILTFVILLLFLYMGDEKEGFKGAPAPPEKYLPCENGFEVDRRSTPWHPGGGAGVDVDGWCMKRGTDKWTSKKYGHKRPLNPAYKPPGKPAAPPPPGKPAAPPPPGKPAAPPPPGKPAGKPAAPPPPNNDPTDLPPPDKKCDPMPKRPTQSSSIIRSPERPDFIKASNINTTESDAQNANKEQSSNVYNSAIQSSIQNINGDIQYIQSLIDQINSKIPRTINDIVAGNISQTDDPKKAYITIRNEPYNIVDPFNPDRPSITTGKWIIDAVLPLGKKGDPGVQGPPGDPGPKGEPGAPGGRGRRGDWGSKP